jgi:hypothetical protein
MSPSFRFLEKFIRCKEGDRELKQPVFQGREASMYVVNHKEFHRQRFLRLSNYMKDQVAVFSALKSYHRFPIAVMFDLRFEKSEEKFQQFLDFIRNSFSHSMYM